MTNFYSIFSIEKRQYQENSPIILEKAVLSKEKNSERLVFQGKFSNMSDKIIRAVKIKIFGYDTGGRVVEDDILYEYLDLNINRGENFGGNVPVLLKNKSIRSFALQIQEVVYDDGTIWTADDFHWKDLPESRPVDTVFADEPVLARQYRKQFGATFSENFGDFWFCACGAQNRSDEEVCYKCGKNLINLSEDEKQAMREADEAEIIADEEKKQQDKVRRKKITKILIIAAVIVAVIAVFAAAIPKIINSEKDSVCGIYTTAPEDRLDDAISSYYTFRIWTDGYGSYFAGEGTWDIDDKTFMRSYAKYRIDSFTGKHIMFTRTKDEESYYFDVDDMILTLPNGEVEDVIKLK